MAFCARAAQSQRKAVPSTSAVVRIGIGGGRGFIVSAAHEKRRCHLEVLTGGSDATTEI